MPGPGETPDPCKLPSDDVRACIGGVEGKQERDEKMPEAEALDHRSERPWLRAAPPTFPTHSLLRRGGRMEYRWRSSGHESVARAAEK